MRIAAAPPDPRSVLALSLAIEIVGADPDARLFQEVRERLGLGYDVGASRGARQRLGRRGDLGQRRARARGPPARDGRAHVPRGGRGLLPATSSRARARSCATASRVWPSLALDRALAHAVRAIGRQPSLAEAARVLDALELADVERAWRRALSAPDAHGASSRGDATRSRVVACALWASAIARGAAVADRTVRTHRPPSRGDRAPGRAPATSRRARRLEHLGLVAYRGGVARPIPFQVDERVPGKGIAMAGGPEPLARRPPRHPRPRRPAGLHGVRRRRARARRRAAGGSGTRDPDRRSARPHDRLGLRRRRRRSAAHRHALRRVRRGARQRARGALSRRHGPGAARRLRRRPVGTDGAEPARRAAPARRGDVARGAGALGDHRARRQARARRLDRGSGARRAPLAPQGRHRDGHPAHRRPGAHLLLRRARLRAGRDEAAVLAVACSSATSPRWAASICTVSRAGTTSRRASPPPGFTIDGHMDAARARLRGPRHLVRARRPRSGDPGRDDA